ncbi:hypothetical protein [Plastoroseomonas hellenica]|uniref:Uncharacterized protein n=1 Tax=Plastoroseomonas hellenica TaxID=2687306 RepID=A0ABS5F8A5_9PROT|nr:hypothetical protein [Plastoroseomonas hellenica]MBR0646826.1 hypothetical protein [Plastoroseomonas hellenica]MBR0668726.1 hypothetical protein [Plastoroseomonas hellenica]
MGSIRRTVIGLDTAVTVRVWIDAAGRQVGMVFLPSGVVAGRRVAAARDAPVSTEQAAVAAIRTAAALGLELVVEDPDGLWDGYMDWLDALPDELLEQAMVA